MNTTHIEVTTDYETSERAGASGTFQVVEIVDGNGNDLTDFVDVGHHYHSIEEVAADVAEALGVPTDTVVAEEV